MHDRHLTQLDGLRGVAILIVLLGHLVTRSIGFGVEKLGPLPPLGVDLFFVLSGFLITNVLLRAKGKDHYFKNFYARRALRISPLYFALLIFMFAIANHRLAALTFDSQRVHWQPFAFYVQNVYYRQLAGLGPLTLAVTWSLAIEEQFYLVWPVLVKKLAMRTLAVIAIGIVLAAPVARLVLPSLGFDPYINPLCRMDAMAIGGLLSLWLFRGGVSPAAIKTKAVYVLAAGACGEILAHFLGLTHILSKSFAALMFAAVLALSLTWEPLCRSLSIAPLRLTGKISYCLYLAHPIIGALVYHQFNGSSMAMKAGRSLAILVFSYGVSMLSWRFFESPILGLKKHFESSTRSKRALPSLDLAPEPLRSR